MTNRLRGYEIQRCAGCELDAPPKPAKSTPPHFDLRWHILAKMAEIRHTDYQFSRVNVTLFFTAKTVTVS